MPKPDIGRFRKLFTHYTELRLQENRTTQVGLVKGNVVSNARSSVGGVSARVCKGGSWGFSSSPDTSDQGFTEVLKAATDNAAFMDSREAKAGLELQGGSVSSDNDFSTKKARLGQKALVDFVKEVDDHIAAKYPSLASRTVFLRGLDVEKYVVTSDGASSHSLIPRTNIHVILVMEKDGQPVELAASFGGLGQFEDLFVDQSEIFESIGRQFEHVSLKAEGVFASAGTKVCVLDAELAGILAHEAIGHTTEADLVLGGSVASRYFNKEAASPLVTLVDFANTALGETCPQPVYVDDEGTLAKDAYIIDKGILKTYLHSKESAARFGVAPTGNARAFSFSDEPLIRMRNTAILPGESTLSDMIASVDDGYYLVRPSNGQADSTSEFMFGVQLGFEIKDGKVGRAIRDTTISGIAFDLLKTVSMVSSDMKWGKSGMCGKKQWVPVGMGGPAVKCMVSIGGR